MKKIRFVDGKPVCYEDDAECVVIPDRARWDDGYLYKRRQNRRKMIRSVEACCVAVVGATAMDMFGYELAAQSLSLVAIALLGVALRYHWRITT